MNRSIKIVWIDGPFGIGKSAVANKVVEKLENAYLLEFDALQDKYTSNSYMDFFGKRYPEAKKYLIDVLVKEIWNIVQEGLYDYVIIPIALINDYCKERLVKGFDSIESYHFILTASCEVLNQRIMSQVGRDIDLAKTYMNEAILYLNKYYSDAVRIETSNKSIDDISEEIIETI